jgi:hypothetical protein
MGKIGEWLTRNATLTIVLPAPASTKNQGEVVMGEKVTGVWTRKPELVWTDRQAACVVYAIISRHPYSIGTIKDFPDEYAATFGADELKVLQDSLQGGKYNMVMSPNEDWVKGDKVYIPPAPKVDPTLREGMKWLTTPFGKVQVPAGQTTANIPTAVAEMSDEMKREMSSIVFEAVTAALKVWAASQ